MKKSVFYVFVTACLVSLVSCMSVKEVPLEKTPAQIIQMGQNAASASSYKYAVYCFNTAIDRYGDDANVYAEAKYEIAHVYLKQKKYEKAYDILQELLMIYDYYPTALPPAYKKLANIGMSKIPEKKLKEIEHKKAEESKEEKTEIIIQETEQNAAQNDFYDDDSYDESEEDEDSDGYEIEE